MFFQSDFFIVVLLFTLGFKRMTEVLNHYYKFEEKHQSEKYALKFLIKYFMRTWVPIVTVILFGLTIMGYIGFGPMFSFSYTYWVECDYCHKWFWANFVYLNSILPFDTEYLMCFQWLWFISAEAILFCFLVVAFLLFRKN